MLPIDQDDPSSCSFGAFRRTRSKRARRQQHALLGILKLKRAHECLNFRCSDLVFPFLGLDIDLLESKPIERDNAVDSVVTAATNSSKSLSARTVAHRVKQIEHENFEESWTGADDDFQEIAMHFVAI